MQTSQQSAGPKLLHRASPRQRAIAALAFLAVAAGFALLWAIGHYRIAIWPFACGFRQKYGLPCPTCGMTTAILAFAQGDIIRSFCVQPTAALFCTLAVAAGFFALLTAAFGVYFYPFERFLTRLKLRYVVATIIIVLAAGWAVTLAQALAERGRY